MELDLWTQSLVTAMTALWTKVANFIPNLFGALVVVLLGFVVAKLLDTLLSKLLAKLGLDRLMAGTGLTKMLGRVGIQVPISTLIGKIVYWFVLLIFLVSAAESLGWSGFRPPWTCSPCICRKYSARPWCCWSACCWHRWPTAWCAAPPKASAWSTRRALGVSPRAW